MELKITPMLSKAVKCNSKLIQSEYYNLPFKNKYFDLQ